MRSASVSVSDAPTSSEEGKQRPRSINAALWSAGFRPFFLAAAFSATVSLWSWLGVYLGYWTFPVTWPLKFLHAHEMLFGFVGAAIAGFMLTAVPNWTQSRPLAGLKLVILVSLWLLARFAVWGAPWLPFEIVATINLAFFPSLIVAILPAIIAAKQRKSIVFIMLLSALFLSQTWAYAGIVGWHVGDALQGLHVALMVICLIIAIISSRIIPNFTRNHQMKVYGFSNVRSHPRRNQVVIVSLLAYLATSQLMPTTFVPPYVLAGLAGIVALSLAMRSWGWGGSTCIRIPILFILHIGHGWLVVGFSLLAAFHLFPQISQQAGFHALTAGAMGTMIVAVMSRASLGHSGRPLIADRATIIAYWLIVSGATIRVLANLLSSGLLEISLGIGGMVWALGFLIFGLRFCPILLSPRVESSSNE